MLYNPQYISIFGISWIRKQARSFFFKFVKYHLFGSSGHGSVPQNNEQPFKFPM